MRRFQQQRWLWMLAAIALIAWLAVTAPGQRSGRRPRRNPPKKTEDPRRKELRAKLNRYPHRILYESNRGRQWDVMVINADGSKPANLTQRDDTDDMYPHASPDGTKIAFLVDEGRGRKKSRNVYTMDARGKNRMLLTANARHPCWSPDGRTIAFTPNEFPRYTERCYATRGIAMIDVTTGERRSHPNKRIYHLYALKWSPCGKWFFATVHGGMGWKYGDLAIPMEGARVWKLKGVEGCRPDFRPDGKQLLWNLSDQAIAVADLDMTKQPPRLANARKVVTCGKDYKVYHGDWSPDGKYIAFSHGPAKGGQDVGNPAKGWHIFVADAARKNVVVQITHDGVSNKEADWLPVGVKKKPKPEPKDPPADETPAP